MDLVATFYALANAKNVSPDVVRALVSLHFKNGELSAEMMDMVRASVASGKVKELYPGEFYNFVKGLFITLTANELT